MQNPLPLLSDVPAVGQRPCWLDGLERWNSCTLVCTGTQGRDMHHVYACNICTVRAPSPFLPAERGEPGRAKRGD